MDFILIAPLPVILIAMLFIEIPVAVWGYLAVAAILVVSVLGFFVNGLAEAGQILLVAICGFAAILAMFWIPRLCGYLFGRFCKSLDAKLDRLAVKLKLV